MFKQEPSARAGHPAVPDSERSGPRPAAVWVIRADGGKYTDRFVAGGFAAVGGALDISSCASRAEIRQCYERAHLEASPAQVGSALGNFAAFLLEMREGDHVITPTADRGSLRNGRIAGPPVFVRGDDGCPHRNRRAVSWDPAPLLQSAFPESLQNTLGSPKAVFRIQHPEPFLETIGGTIGEVRLSTAEETALPGRRPAPAAVAAAGDPQRPEPDLSERSEAGAGEEDGVETEREDESVDEHPFDPSKIKVRTVSVVVEQLISRIRHQEIDLAPDFQRMAGIWNAERKSRLIESLLLRIPIPVFYVAADADENWAVVDGVQRISTIYDYAEGEFPLTRLEYRKELIGKRHEELPRPMQRRISETQMVVNVIEPGTPPEVMFNIFRRINTGGMALNGQEIRHALHRGPVREYLKQLAASEAFRKATGGSVKPDRMKDRECVLRFLAFYLQRWEDYSAKSIDGYLTETMKAINAMPPSRRGEVAADFERAMDAAFEIFGRRAFRRMTGESTPLRPVNMPLLEAWAVQLARCPDAALRRLEARRDEVNARFEALLREDAEFEKAISSSTGTRKRIRTRFAAIHDLVEGFV